MTCAQAHHDYLREHPQELIRASIPIARQRDPEAADGWLEMRSCIHCGSTLTLAGRGWPWRWVYRIATASGFRHARTLEGAAGVCQRAGAAADDVERVANGPYDQAPISRAERRWIRAEVVALAARDVERRGAA